MIRKVSASTVRRKLGEMLHTIEHRGDSVMITKRGKAVAALIDVGRNERLRKLDEAFTRLRSEFAMVFGSLADADGSALLDEVVGAARDGYTGGIR